VPTGQGRWRVVEKRPAADELSDLERLCQVCVDTTGVDGGGVAVLSSERSPVLVHTTDDVARAVGELQYTLGQGPSVDAVASGVPVVVPDIAEHTPVTERWPALRSEIRRLDVRALFAFPINVGAVSLGTLDLYRRAPGALSTRQIGVGVTVGAAIGDSLLAASTGSDPDLRYPMTVHRAAGMVMVQLDSTIEEALVRLRATAFEEGVPLTEVATGVLDGTRSFRREGT
jgi:hypothetical protein